MYACTYTNRVLHTEIQKQNFQKEFKFLNKTEA